MHVANWTDFDLGYFFDDYLGCDTLRNAYFAYNSTEIDGTGGSYGYGNRPPALAVQFLNQHMSSFSWWKNVDSTNGNPFTAIEFDNYIRGRWRNGSPITLGGNGYGGQQPTRYIFSGDPLDSTQWSMYSENIGRNDGRGIGTTGPYVLAPGQSICIETGFVFAQTDTGDNLYSVQILQQRLDLLQSIYDSTKHGCHAFASSGQNAPTSITDPHANSLRFDIAPNPAINDVSVRLAQNSSFDLVVLDVQGKKVFEQSGLYSEPIIVKVKDWASGTYLFVLSSEGQTQTKKLVK